VCAAQSPGGLPAQPRTGLLFSPAVSASQIAFVFGHDIWLAPREGGLAVRLTSPPGWKRNPRFSPDGRTLAFTSNEDGYWNIYTLPITGGVATQLTHHPASKTLSGWTPDGKL